MASNPNPSAGARNLCCIVLLLVVAVGLRVWTIPHTAVPARDGIGFMRYAWQLERYNWIAVLRCNHHPPAYPLSILAIAEPLRHVLGDRAGDILDLSAQLAANLAGILLVVPMYFLGRELFDRRTGFWAALCCQCLPVSAHVLSDALSEPLFLLASATALLLATRGLRRGFKTTPGRQSIGGVVEGGACPPKHWRRGGGGRLSCFVLCGVCAALAYLTRPEGALLVAAASLVLVWLGLRVAAEWPWRSVLVGTLSLWIGAAALAAPYVGIIGHLTQKPTGQKVFEVGGRKELPGVGRLLLAVWYSDDGPANAGWCLGAVLGQVVKGFHYLGCLLLPLGLWWFRDRFRQTPGALVLVLLALLHASLLLRVAMVSGYVSERHALLILMCGLYWVVAAVGKIGDRISAIPQAASALLLLLIVSGLPQALRPLHAHRSGFRAAGRWLAEYAAPTDAIIDPFGWAAHYAGRTYRDNSVPSMPSVNRYFVWDGSKQSYRRARVEAAEVRQWQQGQPVYHWPVQAPLENAAVIVYFLPAVTKQP